MTHAELCRQARSSGRERRGTSARPPKAHASLAPQAGELAGAGVREVHVCAVKGTGDFNIVRNFSWKQRGRLLCVDQCILDVPELPMSIKTMIIITNVGMIHAVCVYGPW